MDGQFNPYREWLGWEGPGKPPHHYALLGLAMFEADAALIENAADQRMRHVRSFQTGRRGRFTTQLLNELAGAKLCLLDPRTKSTYDAALQGWLSAQAAAEAQFAASRPAASPPTPAPPPFEPPAPPTGEPPSPRHFHFPREFSISDSNARSRTEQHAEQENGLPSIGGALLIIPAVLAIAGLVWLGAWLARGPVETGETQNVATPNPPADDPTPAIVQPTERFVVRPDSLGELRFAADTAQPAGQFLRLEERAGSRVIVGWNAAGDAAAWDYDGAKPGIYRVVLTYGAPDGEGGSFTLAIGSSEKTFTIRTGESAFRTEEFFLPVRSRRGTLKVTARRLTAAESLMLRDVQLLPRG